MGLHFAVPAEPEGAGVLICHGVCPQFRHFCVARTSAVRTHQIITFPDKAYRDPAQGFGCRRGMTPLEPGYGWWREFAAALTVGLVAYVGAVALALWYVGAPLDVML
jgi:hypothetical protein